MRWEGTDCLNGDVHRTIIVIAVVDIRTATAAQMKTEYHSLGKRINEHSTAGGAS